MVITPILLSLTCAVFHQTGKFYSKRSKLYEEGLDLLLEQWDKSREIERDEIYRNLSVERKFELLSYLSVKKFEQAQYVLFEQEEIEGYIAEFLGIGQRESRAVLKAIETQHGLLIERARKVWSFSHLTFQEYLIARSFHRRGEQDLLLNHLYEENWKEVFLQIFSIMDNADSYLESIKRRIDLHLSSDQKLQQMIGVAYHNSSLETSFPTAAVRAYYIDSVLDFENEIGSDLFADLIQDSYFNSDGVLGGYKSIEDLNYISAHAGLITIRYYINRSLRALFIMYFFLLLTLIMSILLKQTNFLLRPDVFVKLVKIGLLGLKYRGSSKKWNLNGNQKELLREYYYANYLLVCCLNGGYTVSHRVRKEIQETLFLPIAEIEKRQHKKVDQSERHN